MTLRNERVEPLLVDHAESFVKRLPDGGFVFEAGEAEVRVVLAESGWDVSGIGDRAWRLERPQREPRGFVLSTPDGSREIGRSMPLVGAPERSTTRFVLVEDGRLFRISRRPPGDDGFDLTSWESAGAYLTARPERNGWCLFPEPASCGIPDLSVLSVLLAAEALDAERTLETGR